MLQRLAELLGKTGGQLMLMFAGLILFSIATVIVAKLLGENRDVQLLFVALTNQFSGALFALVRTPHAPIPPTTEGGKQ